MMYTKFSSFLFGFLLLFNFVNAQIHLGGHVDTTLIKKYSDNKLIIKIHESTNAYNNGETTEIPLDSNGDYNININTNSKYTYISFWMHNKNLGLNQLVNISGRFTDLDEVYLFENKDNIKLNIYSDGTFYFEGHKNEKLNCMAKIYSYILPPPIKYRPIELNNLHQYDLQFALLDNLKLLSINLKLAILKSYKSQIPLDIYSLLYLDIIGVTESEIQSNLPFELLGSDEYLEIRKLAVQKYFQSTLTRELDTEIDSTFMAASAYYPEFILSRELNSFKLYTKGQNIREIPFKLFYERLNANYKGNLKDKLIFMCFQIFGQRYVEDSRMLFPDALNKMTSDKYKLLLKDWYNKQNLAYPFELQNSEGKVCRLKDYKGKIVIIDFWFTGCTWCTILNAAMQTIIERYKDNPNVVFLTISTDKNRDTWIKSLESKKYTSSETINLYTNGLGEDHPLIKYYNYVGAPQQLIISQKGYIITSSPPRPDGKVLFEIDRKTGLFISNHKAVLNDPSALAFIKIIDDSLIKTNSK